MYVYIYVYIYIFFFFQWNHEYMFLIMEYCSGGDLSRFIQLKRRLPETIAKKFLQQLGNDYGIMKY